MTLLRGFSKLSAMNDHPYLYYVKEVLGVQQFIAPTTPEISESVVETPTPSASVETPSGEVTFQVSGNKSARIVVLSNDVLGCESKGLLDKMMAAINVQDYLLLEGVTQAEHVFEGLKDVTARVGVLFGQSSFEQICVGEYKAQLGHLIRERKINWLVTLDIDSMLDTSKDIQTNKRVVWNHLKRIKESL